jgi:hypothetical protein
LLVQLTRVESHGCDAFVCARRHGTAVLGVDFAMLHDVRAGNAALPHLHADCPPHDVDNEIPTPSRQKSLAVYQHLKLRRTLAGEENGTEIMPVAFDDEALAVVSLGRLPVRKSSKTPLLAFAATSIIGVEIEQRVLNGGLLRLTAEAEAPRLKGSWFRFYKRFIVRTPLPKWSALSIDAQTGLTSSDVARFDAVYAELFERLPRLSSLGEGVAD